MATTYEHIVVETNQDGRLALKWGGGTSPLPTYLTTLGAQGYQVVTVLYPPEGTPIIILKRSSADL